MHGCEPAATVGKEDLAAGPPLDQRRPALREVTPDRLARLAADGHQPRLLALAEHADDPLVEVEVFEGCAGEFRHAQAAGVEEFEHRAVAQRQRVAGGGGRQGGEELFHLQLVERVGQRTVQPRQGEHLALVLVEVFGKVQMAQKNLDGDEFDLDRTGGQSGAFAGGEVFGDPLQGDATKNLDAVFLRDPPGKTFQRPAHGKLVVVRQPAFGGEITDELFNEGLHDQSLPTGDDARRAWECSRSTPACTDAAGGGARRPSCPPRRACRGTSPPRGRPTRR